MLADLVETLKTLEVFFTDKCLLHKKPGLKTNSFQIENMKIQIQQTSGP
jgi:hypothetical protein